MVTRRNLKPCHENAILNLFMNYLKNKNINLTIINRPDPPDAVVEVDGKERWIEIVDCFQDEIFAKTLTTNVCDDKNKVPFEGKHINPISQFSQNVCSEIQKKYHKESMRNVAKSRGPGILIVGINTPYIESLAKFAKNEKDKIANMVAQESCKVFNEIYLYRPYAGGTFCKLL